MTKQLSKIQEPHFIIRSGSALSSLQQKAWIYLYLSAKNSLDDDFHYLPLSVISNALETTYRDYLKRSLKAMNRATVQWDVTGDDDCVKEWTTSSIVGSATIKDNVLVYEFTKKMKELFRANPGFAELDFPVMLQIKGKHALKLWRFCKIYKDTLTGSTGWKSVQVWRDIFGLKRNEHKEFKIFKRDVISRAIKEINEVSDIRIEAEYKKNGRIVTEIRFLRISEVKEEPKQINDAPSKIPQLAWLDTKTKAIQKKLDAEFDTICKTEDPYQRQIEWGQYLAVKMKKDAQGLPLFLD